MRLMKVGQNGVEMLQKVTMGCNKACQIPQKLLKLVVHHRVKQDMVKHKNYYKNSSNEQTSLLSSFVSEIAV